MLLVIPLLRRNPVELVVAGVLQRRAGHCLSALGPFRPVIARVLVDLVPAPCAFITAGTALVHGAGCPDWD